jgi:hypothetical protein
MEFQDNDSLMAQIKEDMTDVVDYVSSNIVELIKGNVEEIVYNPFIPRSYATSNGNRRYGEEGGFLGSWTTDLSYTDTGNAIAKIYSDPELMVFDSLNHVHGHPEEESGQTQGLFGDMIDRREIMDAAIAEGTNYDFFMVPKEGEEQDPDENWWTRPRDYFTPTIERLDSSEFDRYVDEGLRKNKFNFEKLFTGTSFF